MKNYVTKLDKEFFMNCLQYGIRKLKNHAFEKFVEIFKTLEWLIVKKLPIIVTTCKAAKSNIFNDIHFSQVIIDEATQSYELETLETILYADQVVLVGD